MNAKINKDFNSFEFINKVTFYLLILTLLSGILLQFLILKNSVNVFNLPFLIAVDLSNQSFITNGSIFKYFNHSSAFIFSIIFYYFIIPFAFIFSTENAIKLLKERKFSKQLLKYEIFNFVISFVVIIILIVLLAYNSFVNVQNNSQVLDLQNKIQEAKIAEVANNFALGAREKMVLPLKYNGWGDISKDKFVLYKQLNANYINAFINDTTNKFILKVIPQTIDINFLSLKLKPKNFEDINLTITPKNHFKN